MQNVVRMELRGWSTARGARPESASQKQSGRLFCLKPFAAGLHSGAPGVQPGCEAAWVGDCSPDLMANVMLSSSAFVVDRLL